MKRVMMALAVALVGFGVFVGITTRDIGPTQANLVAGDLPPLIPTRAFYADPRAEYSFYVSSDGIYTASWKAGIFGENVVVREVASGEEIARFPSEIGGLRWHPTEPRLRFIYKGHDWEADVFDAAQENWRRTSPVKLSGGWVLNEFATDPDQSVLFWGKTHQNATAHMWAVSQDGLTAEKAAEGNEKTEYWVFDQDQNARLRADWRDTGHLRIFRRDGEAWNTLMDVSVNDTFAPLSKVDGDGKLLARSSRGRDKVALVSFDVETGEEHVLVENPDADVALPTSLKMGGGPDVIRLGTNAVDRVALTPRGQVFLDLLAEFPQPVSLGHTSVTPSGRYVAQAISPQGASWIYLLMDLEEKTYQVLDESFFRKFKEHLTQSRAVTFTARDGMDIPAVLTLPQGVEGPIPFVVYVHGGPAQHINLGYSGLAQFLANRGYGFLAVNFRGSTGFGKEFQAAGFREFGRAMQDDVTDAALWLVGEGLADTDALVAMGISYGGYAAAMAMTRDPGLFDAAVVEFPMLDAEFQTRNAPGFWERGMNAWWRYFGKVEEAEDLADMRAYSPINRVEDLHGPLLVMGGVQDNITSVQQVRQFEEKARAAGKDVTTHYFANAGHGAHRWRDKLTQARLIEDFLAEHAGGRSGGTDLAEWMPEFLD